MKKRFWRLALLSLVTLVGCQGMLAFAKGYPDKPIHMVVPFSVGGPLDTVARLFAPPMAAALGQPVIVENHAGASGIIGSNIVAKAAPDGYTALFDAGLAILPAMFSDLPFKASDFVPVSELISMPLVLVASPKLHVTTTQQLIALAKSEPGKLNFGHSGLSSPLYLMMELFKLSAHINMQGIPYPGSAQINLALLSGQVDVAMQPLSAVIRLIKAGRLRALGVSSRQRSPSLPNVETIAAGGVPGFHYVGWQGLFVPAGTPHRIVMKLYRAAAKALQAPKVHGHIMAVSQTAVGSTPEQFAAKYQADLARFASIVKEAHVPMRK